MTDEDGVIHFESPDEMERQIREDLAELTGRTPEEIEEAAAEYDHPDLNEEDWIPADEFYGDE